MRWHPPVTDKQLNFIDDLLGEHNVSKHMLDDILAEIEVSGDCVSLDELTREEASDLIEVLLSL